MVIANMLDISLPQILVSLFLGGSIFLLIWSLFRFPVSAEPPMHRRVAAALGVKERETLFEQPALAPLLSLAVTLSKRIRVAALRNLVRVKLDASGNPSNYSIDEYIALCLFFGVGMGLVTIVAVFVFLGTIEPLTPTLMAGIGFALPLVSLNQAAASRISRIGKKLPYTMDLIALMMEAGSTYSEAVATIIRDEPDDDFNQELSLVQTEIDFGTPRAQALTNMAERIPLDSLRSVVGAINQAEALGTPLGAILKSQAGMMRMYRSVRAEKLSASASLRILVPSMLILLAVVIVVFGPVIMNWAASGFRSLT